MRWTLLTALVAAGAADAAEIDAERAREDTATGRERAARARAARPTAEAKEEAWAAAVEGSGLPNAVVDAVAHGFTRPGTPADLLRPFVERYHAHARHRRGARVARASSRRSSTASTRARSPTAGLLDAHPGLARRRTRTPTRPCAASSSRTATRWRAPSPPRSAMPVTDAATAPPPRPARPRRRHRDAGDTSQAWLVTDGLRILAHPRPRRRGPAGCCAGSSTGSSTTMTSKSAQRLAESGRAGRALATATGLANERQRQRVETVGSLLRSIVTFVVVTLAVLTIMALRRHPARARCSRPPGSPASRSASARRAWSRTSSPGSS